MATARLSAGIVLFRMAPTRPEVLLGHMGGPYWQRKDAGAWTIPKGEVEPGEELFDVARREFEEELGIALPTTGPPIDLGSVKQSGGKTVHAWAVEGDLDADAIVSNTFDLEWPPKSGRVVHFPELDRAAWFDLGAASEKIITGQRVLLERLAERTGAGASGPG